MTEHYSTLKRTSRFNPDAELELRSLEATALSATTTATAKQFNFYLDKHDNYKLVIFHDAVSSYTAGSAFWKVELEVSADNSTYYSVASINLKAAADKVEVPISGFTVGHYVEDATYGRVKFTKIGSPGNLTAGAYLALV